MPHSPRSWVRWAAYVLESQGRPFSPRYDGIPRTDPRMRDSKETALSVKMILERVTNGNGAGRLVVAYYVDEVSWHSFTPSEQWIMRKTLRAFRTELIRSGLIADPDQHEEI